MHELQYGFTECNRGGIWREFLAVISGLCVLLRACSAPYNKSLLCTDNQWTLPPASPVVVPGKRRERHDVLEAKEALDRMMSEATANGVNAVGCARE
jgi:hypothetical protein